MDMINYCEYELNLINYKNKKEIMEIVDIICNQGHSGFSIGFIINAIRNKNFETRSNMFKEDFDEIKNLIEPLGEEDIVILTKLLKYLPLSPLTLEDDEWIEYIDGHYQNKRLSGLFKDGEDDRPHYIHAVTCVNQNGIPFNAGMVWIKNTNKYYLLRRAYPKQFNEFPTIKINVEDIEVAKDDWECYTTEEEINKVKEFYDLEWEKGDK